MQQRAQQWDGMFEVPRNRWRRRRRRASEQSTEDKAYKICSVLGGLDVTRFVSLNTRHFFEGAIEDVELVREFVSEAATNKGIVGGLHNLNRLDHTLDWKARGFTKPTTTVEAGIGYSDDRPDRRIDRMVIPNENKPLVGDKQTDMAIVDTVSLIFPWIVDRKSNEGYWWDDHQNGRSEGPTKEPFLFDSLYTAAWIGSYGEAWAYYPPFQKMLGHPFTVGDVIGNDYDSHTAPFVEPNFPKNNPERMAFFRSPYPDAAQTGLSLITALAPIYFTGTFGNYTYNDTYIASTGLDIAVSSVSSLLDVLKDTMTYHSFGILVSAKDFKTIVISQSVVERIYPERTGFEEYRVTHDLTDGSIIDDRRNQTYLVSDTIYESLTDLTNAKWSSLLADVKELRPGERDFSTLNLTLTRDESPTEFFIMYERWKYVADWVLMAFAPKTEVENAISVGLFSESRNESFMSLEGEKGHVLIGEAALVNRGTLDVAVTLRSMPDWFRLTHAIYDSQTLGAGDTLPLMFNVLTDGLDYGTSSVLLTFNIQDDEYPDCFYNQDISLKVTVKVSPKDCFRITGDPLRRPDSTGNCICKDGSVEIGGKCISFFVLLPAILIPLLVLIVVCVYLYVEHKRKQSDTIWAVKTSELKFDDPPVVVGRGTFGLVLLAEYRGTQVAVKRVIPPRINVKQAHGDKVGQAPRRLSLLGMNSAASASGNASLLFNFQDRNGTDDASGNSDESFSNSWQASSSLAPHSMSMQRSIKKRWSLWNNAVRPRTSYEKLKDDFVDEMRHLSKLRHPCITTVMGAVISKWEEPLLIMEFMEQGSLYDLLHNESMIMEGYLVLPILRDIAQGVRFLHAATPKVIHGDLKAQNVLVDSKFRAKVADFGLSQKKQVGATGTPLWMAPELLRGESENTTSSDVYSFGIILYEVYSRKMPYEDEPNKKKVLQLVCDKSVNKRPPIPEPMPTDVASLMTESLAGDPAERPTFNELDARLKKFDVENVEPGEAHWSMQARKYREAAAMNEKLLLDIFPKHVADALLQGRKVEAEHFDVVTIFFSDIVGFTTISHSLTPRKVSDMLDRLYLKFDALSHKHRVFKIETIGDAWMGVTNLSEVQPDHTKRVAEFAIDAIKAANETMIDEDDPASGFVQIRVGLHSGPVLANVVGSRNPKYTIIGDTVNTSARMESNSLPGRIQCSDVSADLLKKQAPELPLVHRGKISVKGKGDMDTYWVNEFSTGRSPGSDEGTGASAMSEATPLIRITMPLRD